MDRVQHKLTADDYRGLQESYIPPDIADAAGLYRVDSLEGADLVGRRNTGDYSGIVFPYRWPGTTSPIAYRVRLDHPPFDAATGKPKNKYLSAPGMRNA